MGAWGGHQHTPPPHSHLHIHAPMIRASALALSVLQASNAAMVPHRPLPNGVITAPMMNPAIPNAQNRRQNPA